MQQKEYFENDSETSLEIRKAQHQHKGQIRINNLTNGGPIYRFTQKYVGKLQFSSFSNFPNLFSKIFAYLLLYFR
jgi:hypothetical protein